MFVNTTSPPERVVKLLDEPSLGELNMIRFLGFYNKKSGELILGKPTMISFRRDGNLIISRTVDYIVSVQVPKGRWKYHRR